MNLSKRKEELQKEFEQLQTVRKDILEKAKELQQKLTATDIQIQQVQGAHREILNIENDDVVLEEKSKKEQKEKREEKENKPDKK